MSELSLLKRQKTQLIIYAVNDLNYYFVIAAN